MAKSQITLFIVLGLLALAALAFISLVWVGRELGLISPAVRPALVRSIDRYVLDCLEIALVDGLERAGKQGLRLEVDYREPPYWQPLERGHPTFGALSIPYTVRAPRGRVGDIYFSELPLYPWIKFPYIWEGGNVTGVFFLGYFGTLTLPALYPWQGKNSLQEQLEKYIIERVKDCAKLNEAFGPQNLEFDIGTPSASLVIDEEVARIRVWDDESESVHVKLLWPMNVKDKGTGASTRLEEFVASARVRLGKAYYYLRQTFAGFEVTDASFNITDQPEVVVERDVRGKDDLVMFRDKHSRLRDQPFEIWLLRENRAPAMFDIGKHDAGACAGATLAGKIDTINGTPHWYLVISQPEGCPLSPVRIPPGGPFESKFNPKFVQYIAAVEPDEDILFFCADFAQGAGALMSPNKPLQGFSETIGPGASTLIVAACDAQCGSPAALCDYEVVGINTPTGGGT